MRFFILFLILTLCPSYNQSIKAQEKIISPFAKIIRPLSFELPIDCDVGNNCHVMNYVDMMPDDGVKTDPFCEARTYDSHKGTDFSLLDIRAMRRGVDVLAAMDGTIKRIRDGELDKHRSKVELEAIRKERKECGNAVLIEHENNVQTIYCHLKNGSVEVKPDQTVRAGDVIAQVGMSGLTEFPHLHFGIIKDKAVIDPFTGLNNKNKCGTQKQPLWDAKIDIQYEPLIIHSLGFKDSIPSLEKIEQSTENVKSINKTSDIFSFWVNLLGVKKGDEISLKIFDPNGQEFSKRAIIQDKTRARQFYYAGKKNAYKTLSEGIYSAQVIVKRPSKISQKVPMKWEKSIAVSIQENSKK